MPLVCKLQLGSHCASKFFPHLWLSIEFPAETTLTVPFPPKLQPITLFSPAKGLYFSSLSQSLQNTQGHFLPSLLPFPSLPFPSLPFPSLSSLSPSLPEYILIYLKQISPLFPEQFCKVNGSFNFKATVMSIWCKGWNRKPFRFILNQRRNVQ